MKKIVIIILTAALLIAAVLYLIGSNVDRTMKPAADMAVTQAAAENTAQATETPQPREEAAAEPEAQENAEAQQQEQPFLVQVTDSDPSVAYVLVRMQNAIGLLPLPMEGEYTRTIRQKMADGTEAVNVLHLTTNGVWMEDSNCEGHDCINEGEVTLENREERVLWNMIICLPHQLSLELITREEALQMTGQK